MTKPTLERHFMDGSDTQGMSEEDAFAKVKDFQEQCLQKYGFYFHCVFDDPSSPTGFNVHTHGLKQDFQIVLNLPEQVMKSIFFNLSHRLEQETFEDGQELQEVIANNLSVKLLEVTEGDRKVFRIIFPDPRGNLDEEVIEEQYRSQYITNPLPEWFSYPEEEEK